MVGNVNKPVLTKTTKTLSSPNFSSKYRWVINNTDIDIAKDFKFTNIKKYQKWIG